MPSRRLDIVVPARNEQALLPRCLRSLLADGGELALRVIVVVDDSSDRTLDVANGWRAWFAAAGHDLHVVESAGGKAAALNRGDRHRRGCATLYLDADVVVAPGTLVAIVDGLDTDVPRLVAPPPRFVRSNSRLSRDFTRVWSALPAVADDVIGLGAYAVNPAGRYRWDRFPAVVADDAFVRSRFAPRERLVLRRGGFFVELPGGRSLVSTVARWRSGNVALRNVPGDQGRGSDPGAGTVANVRSVRRNVTALLAFGLVSVLARFGPRGPGGVSWDPARPPAAGNPASARPSVQAVVVTYNSALDILSCLDSLTSAWGHLRIAVVDNASTDSTAELVAAERPGVALIRNRHNLGFARAANDVVASRGTGTDYVLLVNPDARLTASTVDELLALAVRFPDAGLYGGRMLDAQGTPDPTSCLAAPSLRQALAFGTGTSAHPATDPDGLGRWPRTGVREVPVLTAGCLLVDHDLWRRLGGFDERFFLYGEDVDLCLRARALGARPMFTGYAEYTHRGGGSSGTDERTVNILRGKVTLYRLHLRGPRRALALRSLVAGVLLRRTVDRVRRRHSQWTHAWERRACWRCGHPAADERRPGRPHPQLSTSG